MTLDGSDDFSHDDQVLLQIERLNNAVENVSATVSAIGSTLDRMQVNQQNTIDKLGAAIAALEKLEGGNR